MLKVRLESSELKAQLAKIKSRVADISTYHRQVTRPFLLRQLGIAYHEAGIGVRTSRSACFIDRSRIIPNIVSVITPKSIIVGTRVPYAVFVERRNPIASRVARSNALVNLIEQTLPEYLTRE